MEGSLAAIRAVLVIK